jgi:hypothetical protein
MRRFRGSKGTKTIRATLFGLRGDERDWESNVCGVRCDPLISSVGIAFSMDSGLRRNDIVV